MRIVLDTNVVISAFLVETSNSSRAFDRAQESGDLLSSTETIEELAEVIARRKFDRYLPRKDRLVLLDAYIRSAQRIAITEHVQACRDPRDDKFLSLAVSGRADLIITGDADLL